ncbi:HNH endonuclease [Paenibacillus filicis]|uniref:Putative HNH nuclease YajD n=1 Tax=Paenibacillus filicis TaxID=669464 RepID=A0ABU9DVL4_9BACL
MAVKPKRPCGKAGCRNLASGRYCAEHAHLAEVQKRERHKHYDQHKRDKQATAFYGSKEWDRLRRARMGMDHGLCQDCLQEKRITMADVVDHIKPIRWFWDMRLVVSNLRSLCHLHHNIKTAEDVRKYGR